MSAHIVVIGNEKGGCGKTTTVMHLIVSLIKLGFRVGSIDLDLRQQSITSYIKNRDQTRKNKGIDLELPNHHLIIKSKNPDLAQGIKEEQEQLLSVINDLKATCDFIIIDTPGSDTELSRTAHSYANTIITPINDSFVDVDLLGKISADSLEVITPGIYSAMVWEQKLKRAARDKGEIKWIVLRNRISPLETINQKNIMFALEKLSKKFGFEILPGFSDRVIFKELFLHGLTLHDVGKTTLVRISTSMIAARQELRDFILSLKMPEVSARLEQQQAEIANAA